MYFVGDSLDDLLYKSLPALLRQKTPIEATKGAAFELVGVLFKLKNPRARLSRSASKGIVVSPLGEFLWYISGNDHLSQIQYYLDRYKSSSDDGVTLNGAYGPRIFKYGYIYNQYAFIRDRLKDPERSDSRRCVMPIITPYDVWADHKDVPCTSYLQFFLRNKRLHLSVSMRSNDVMWGFPHDIFAFTMLQETLARDIGVDIGHYHHHVGSFHLYDNPDTISKAEEYIREGLQRRLAMPKMPSGDPWSGLQKLLVIEKALRLGRHLRVENALIDPYWRDLAIILRMWQFSKSDQYHGDSLLNALQPLTDHLHDTYFRDYIRRRIVSARARLLRAEGVIQ